jgi:hypothetical protein
VVEEELDLLRALGGVPTADPEDDPGRPAGWGGVQ